MKIYFYFAIGLIIGPLGIMLAQSDPTKIRSVTINGNESISQKELTGLLRQKPSSWLLRGAKLEPRLVKLDALTLKNYFHSQGFLDAIIKGSYQIENDFADLFFNIVEGKWAWFRLSGKYCGSKHRPVCFFNLLSPLPM